MAENFFLVIGSNCFTGSHIVDRLLDDKNNTVIGISRSPEYKDIYLPYKKIKEPNFVFYQIDIVRELDRLIGLIDREKPAVVINAAALSEVALSNEVPVEYFETNTLAIVKLCNYLRKTTYLKQYVHISSAEIYGSCQTALNEEALFNPSTPYAVSKAAADMYINIIMKKYGFPATLIRTTNVYGKHQQLFKIIQRAIIYLKQGKVIELHGGGQAMKSFIHIRDVVDGIMLTIRLGKIGTYHFAVASEETVADIVRYLCEFLGKDFKKSIRIVRERSGQDARYWLDCSKAKRDLGWEPKVKLENGLKEVIEWIEKNWDVIKDEPLVYIHKNLEPVQR